MPYDHASIERKWQDRWEAEGTFRATEDPARPKFYVLDMFPYPSAEGLHVGHPEGYTASDIVARYKRMRGFNVLHPMGWDAFGLPTENYALRTGTHPKETTLRNINRFRTQLKRLGFSYDWSREVDTTDPKYYRWTQWIFLQLYRRGLAYRAEAPINWCESCKTGLANEEAREGVCDRCGGTVVKRSLRQWVLRITRYAERLLEDLEELDWPDNIKEMQRNWIGRSTGVQIRFPLPGADEAIEVFTTRPDTLYGATYMVMAPEHPLVEALTVPGQRPTVRAYVEAAQDKSDLARTDLAREKTGVFTGAFAINPATETRIPIWVADYVLMTYGTGAIMAVPAHDQRDWEFAREFGLPVVEVVSGGDIAREAHTEDGILVNSPVINGLGVAEAKERITRWLEERGLGRRAVNYKLRDWIFSRQRYWGEPFPLIHLDDGQVKPLPDESLPLELPDVENYRPTGTGESPLVAIREWVETTDPETGRPALRETDTMPQWAGSCWYYLRFIDPDNDRAGWDPEKERYWMPVDLYVGGAEHAVLHLLYARFWHKVLYDLGYVSTQEPFRKLVNQGLILGEDREKMSKSRGNVVNPDAVVETHGADGLRLYEMFMGPLETVKAWNTRSIEGVSRFLHRVWNLVVGPDDNLSSAVVAAPPEGEEARILHKTVRQVTEDIERMRFNTAISRMMEFVNFFLKLKQRSREALEAFVLILSPFAPHLGEELWEKLGHSRTLAGEPWPSFDAELARDEVITVAVQINGKVRDRVEVPADIDEDAIVEVVLTRERVRKLLGPREPRKVFYVRGRLVSIVV